MPLPYQQRQGTDWLCENRRPQSLLGIEQKEAEKLRRVEWLQTHEKYKAAERFSQFDETIKLNDSPIKKTPITGDGDRGSSPKKARRLSSQGA